MSARVEIPADIEHTLLLVTLSAALIPSAGKRLEARAAANLREMMELHRAAIRSAIDEASGGAA